MKKSDFIDALYKSDLYDLIVTAEDAFDVHYTLGKIIEKAVELGMFPPTILEFYGPASEVNCDPYIKVNKWDKEDKR